MGREKSSNARYLRFRRAALAPSLPRAVRTRLGKCLTVRFRLAAAAAFFMLRRAAARCLEELIISVAMSSLRQYRQPNPSLRGETAVSGQRLTGDE